ncbi:MAG: helix-turn-helix domain-containing protein [Oscillospiraceae bacterium]|nr:helix-turn-helix domain-containing protein [Oscillospiraceae bacterium]
MKKKAKNGEILPFPAGGYREEQGAIPFDKALREGRRRRKISQQELASLLGVTRNTVINWEAGKSRPDLEKIPAICEALEIPAGDLFSDRPGKISGTEDVLLHNFRLLSPTGQRIAARILSDMVEEEIRAKDRELRESVDLFLRYDGCAAAGIGCEVPDTRPTPLLLRRSSRNAGADAILEVRGDSMEPVYHDGDLLYYRFTQTARPGQDVICLYPEGRIVKRVGTDGKLHSVNPALPFPDPGEFTEVRIEGVVTGVLSEEDLPDSKEREALEELFHDELAEFRRKYGAEE